MANTISSFILYTNNYVDIIHDACKICYKGKPEDSREKKLKYIEHKIKLGHESVIEHSNIIMIVSDELGIDGNLIRDYAEVLESSKHLHSKRYEDRGVEHYIFAGSIRGFKNIFRNIENHNNIIAKHILNTLYSIEKEFFIDFISAGIMEEGRFIDGNIGTKMTNIISDKYEIVSIDPLDDILNMINNITGDKSKISDLLEMVTCTIHFKKMSRIISQQLTRHRNAISQKSQRYVDEEGSKLILPKSFEDKEKSLSFSNTTNQKMSDLIKNPNVMYNIMRKCGFTKEDARYFLFQGTETELFITFTLKNLLHFLSIRSDKPAQEEIRELSIDILEDFSELTKPILSEDLFKYLIPKYMLREVDYDFEVIEDNI